jgi:hypothetical protein
MEELGLENQKKHARWILEIDTTTATPSVDLHIRL